jgi:signal transduction histidine kinase
LQHRRHRAWHPSRLSNVLGLALATFILCYLIARLGGGLVLRPQMVSPLWLGNVFLASALVLARRKFWPIFLIAGLSGFLLFDIGAGRPTGPMVWLILSNAVEILTAAFCLTWAFQGVPELNNMKALARYSVFAVFLPPFVGAFLGASSQSSQYWATWKIAFLSEALGFLTLMPAILGWMRDLPIKKPRILNLEAAALLVAAVALGMLAFAAPENHITPVLLFSFVPLLLWSALRFGSRGVSTSMLAIAFVAIWAAVRGRGPFSLVGPLSNVLSLQVFLFSMAAPFMVLAVLVEERKSAADSLRKREQELREAQRLAQTGSWTWNPRSDVVTWSAELYRMTGYDFNKPTPLPKDHRQFFTPDSWARLTRCINTARRKTGKCELELSGIGASGRTLRLIVRIETTADASGLVLLRGTVQDVTSRKLTEEALLSATGRLITAQEEERARVARELHDDLAQRMVLLQIGLEEVRGRISQESISSQELDRIVDIASQISTDIHDISHQLHPSRIDALGLSRSLDGLCQEFSSQHRLRVQFLHDDTGEEYPKDVSFCLYRIAQEGLRNVAKHSGALQADVRLSSNADEICLSISDSGCGFDPDSANGATGLGFVSMRERLRLLGGELSIQSGPSRGTRIRVRIPRITGTTRVNAGTIRKTA